MYIQTFWWLLLRVSSLSFKIRVGKSNDFALKADRDMVFGTIIIYLFLFATKVLSKYQSQNGLLILPSVSWYVRVVEFSKPKK